MTREYTIRNKAKAPILTLTPVVMAAALKARPESWGHVWSKRRADYRSLTGFDISLDDAQTQLLSSRAGADPKGMWHSSYSSLNAPLCYVVNIFAQGFQTRTLSESMVHDLNTCECFYDLVDVQLKS